MGKVNKDYKEWMNVKARVNNYGIVRSFKEGEVWWAAMGENIGTEIDGKSSRYSRPIIILKKHSKLCFTAIPLTSRPHIGSWYYNFTFRGKTQYAVLVQTKTMDVTRLYKRIGELSKRDYKEIRDAYLKLI